MSSETNSLELTAHSSESSSEEDNPYQVVRSRRTPRKSAGKAASRYSDDPNVTDSGKPKRRAESTGEQVPTPLLNRRSQSTSNTPRSQSTPNSSRSQQSNRRIQNSVSRLPTTSAPTTSPVLQAIAEEVLTEDNDDTEALQYDSDDEFLVRAGIASATPITNITMDKLGSLLMLPNSMVFIPSRCITIVARVYRKYMLSVLDGDGNTEERWKKFFLIPTVLFTDQSSGNRVEDMIRKCTHLLNDDWSSFTLESLRREQLSFHREGADAIAADVRHMNKAVTAAVFQGNIAKGYQRAISSTKPAVVNADVIEKLQAKHPSRAQMIAPVNGLATGPQIISPVSDTVPLVELSVEDVKWALRNAKKGTKHGIDKLRVEHLRALFLYGDQDDTKLFTRLCNKIANAQLPDSVWPWLRDSELIALPKGDDDVRPIAIAGTQYGMTRSGADKVVHILRAASEVFPDDCNLVVLDAINAFNSARREPAFSLARQHFSPLMRIINALYGGQSSLRLNQAPHALVTILAEMGVQQGCVLGSWLYCLSIHPLIEKIQEAMAGAGMVKFFMDDGNLAGTFEVC